MSLYAGEHNYSIPFICLLALVGIYVIGFIIVFALHMFELPMVTLPLALFRSAVWPIWLVAGWPHGTPLPMD